MQVLGFTSFPLTFPPERNLFPTTMKVSKYIPYGMMVGASVCYQHQSAFIFEEGKEFRPDRSSKWMPCLNRNIHPHASPLVNRLRALTTRIAYPPPSPPRLTPPPLSIIALLPAAGPLAFEWKAIRLSNVRFMDDTVLEGAVDLVANKGPRVPGFVNEILQCSVSSPRPQNRQLVMILPKAHMVMDNDATLGMATLIQWWDGSWPASCVFVTQGKNASISCGQPIARMITVHVQHV